MKGHQSAVSKSRSWQVAACGAMAACHSGRLDRHAGCRGDGPEVSWEVVLVTVVFGIILGAFRNVSWHAILQNSC